MISIETVLIITNYEKIVLTTIYLLPSELGAHVAWFYGFNILINPRYTLMSLSELLDQASGILEARNKLVYLPLNGTATIIGDIHGDYQTLNNIINKTGLKSKLKQPDNYLIMLGDYVDRGPNQVKVLKTVAKLIINYPEQVMLLRGNHEGPNDTPAHPRTLHRELSTLSNPMQSLKAFNQFKNQLYTAAIIPGYAFLVHGHIPTNTNNLNSIEKAHTTHPGEETLVELLWNDPANTTHDMPSFRGHGHYVGTETVDRFLKQHNLNYVIRGHELHPEGYRRQNKTFTLHTTNNKNKPILHIPLKNPTNPTEHTFLVGR
ncbi:metallophosphoesterase family protein [Thermoproteota archaeon]